MSTINLILIFVGGCATGICIFIGILFYLSSKKEPPVFQELEYDIDCEHDFEVKYAFTGEILVCKYCKWTIIDSELINGTNRDKIIINNVLEKLEAPVRITITSFDNSVT
jgi:hypothetical protein